MIELHDIGKVYESSDGQHRALEGVNLTINDSDMFGIIGESGAGKSTLVRLLNLLERPTEGRIIIDGADITDYRDKKLRELRASIGMIFQNFSLFQQRSVLRNVTFPLEVRGEEKEARVERARELLTVENKTVTETCALVGLSEVSYFIRIFKRITGETPANYKRRILESRDTDASDSVT